MIATFDQQAGLSVEEPVDFEDFVCDEDLDGDRDLSLECFDVK